MITRGNSSCNTCEAVATCAVKLSDSVSKRSPSVAQGSAERTARPSGLPHVVPILPTEAVVNAAQRTTGGHPQRTPHVQSRITLPRSIDRSFINLLLTERHTRFRSRDRARNCSKPFSCAKPKFDDSNTTLENRPARSVLIVITSKAERKTESPISFYRPAS